MPWPGQVFHVVTFRFQAGFFYINIVTVFLILHSNEYAALHCCLWGLGQHVCSVRIEQQCNRIYVHSVDPVLE